MEIFLCTWYLRKITKVFVWFSYDGNNNDNDCNQKFGYQLFIEYQIPKHAFELPSFSFLIPAALIVYEKLKKL